MKKIFVFVTALIITLAGFIFTIPAAEAGGEIKINDTKSFSIGAGLRTSLNIVEDGAPNGDDNLKKISVDNIRLYTSGQVYEKIKLEFNTEHSGGDVQILDVVAKLEFTDLFNIWAGRFLPPSDRSNLDGPYYLNTWAFPLVQAYPAIFAGRDNGLAIWGQVGGGQFKYQVGAFEGRDGVGTSNPKDNLLYAARLTYNFWDPEPGYYNSSTYYGAKDVLAIGLVLMSQNDGAGTATTSGNFRGWNIDVLMEKKLGSVGVVNLEGAYYNYDLDDVADASYLTQGNAYFVLASYLLPNKIGIGQLQPNIRYQSFDRDNSNGGINTGDRTRFEAGMNYIIDGHNARVTLLFANDEDKGANTSANSMLLGLQLQI